MRAVLCTEYADPGSLSVHEVADPVAKDTQVLVAIHAAGVNFVDGLLVAGRYQIKIPPPFVPGGDLAGEVIAAGREVAGFAPGDRVLASPGIGAFAERIALDPSALIRMPPDMTYAAAAVFMQASITAYFALHTRGAVRAGETVLVLGAAGGTGAAAIQVARAAGARVIAAASSAEKLAACRALGADELIDYSASDLRAELRRAGGEHGIDLVFDPVGGELAQPALRSMAENGRYLVIGFASGTIPSLPLNLPLLKQCQVVGVNWGAYAARHPAHATQLMQEVLALGASGALKDPPITRYPLEQAGQAIADLAGRRAIGKCVIEIDA